jgi:hypothetical protein
MRWPSRCLPRSLHAAGHKAHNLHWITYMTAVDGHFHNHAWIEGNAGGRCGDEHRRGQRASAGLSSASTETDEWPGAERDRIGRWRIAMACPESAAAGVEMDLRLEGGRRLFSSRILHLTG